MFGLKLKSCGLTNLVGIIVFGKLSAINVFVDFLPVAVCSGIANSFLSFRHDELITIFGAVVKPTLGELSAYGYPVQGFTQLLLLLDVAELCFPNASCEHPRASYAQRREESTDWVQLWLIRFIIEGSALEGMTYQGVMARATTSQRPGQIRGSDQSSYQLLGSADDQSAGAWFTSASLTGSVTADKGLGQRPRLSRNTLADSAKQIRLYSAREKFSGLSFGSGQRH
ncbi:hypothetical protein Tco_1403567 [Tanacetum coccineum]